MKRKEFSSKMTGKLYASLLVFFVFMLLIPDLGYSYEREVILGDVYQTEKEKESLKDRFRLDLSVGYGYSNAQILTGIYGPDPRLATYLDRLDMDYSENLAALRLTATYTITQQMGIYLSIPFGAVKYKKEEGISRIFEEDKLGVGLGDIYGGVYYNILSGTKTTPNIVTYVDVNSDIAKYYSLGDGLWDITPGIQIRQLLSDSFYIFGLADYTFRLKKKDIDSGDIFGYGGGIGFILGRMDSVLEFGLKAATIDETKINNTILFDKDEDLTFFMGIKSLYKGSSFYLTISNLDEGIDFERNSFGFEFSFPIY